jgi:hypothetical protein
MDMISDSVIFALSVLVNAKTVGSFLKESRDNTEWV